MWFVVQTLKRQFQGILNKLTPEKYETLLKKVLELKITTEEQLNSITDLMFEKVSSAFIVSCLIRLRQLRMPTNSY